MKNTNSLGTEESSRPALATLEEVTRQLGAEGSANPCAARCAQGRVVHPLWKGETLSSAFFPKPVIWLALIAWGKWFFVFFCFANVNLQQLREKTSASPSMGQQGLHLMDGVWHPSVLMCSPEMVVGEQSLCGGSRSGGPKSLLPP